MQYGQFCRFHDCDNIFQNSLGIYYECTHAVYLSFQEMFEYFRSSDLMFPLADQIARCFRLMKENGFIPSLFVTREGTPPPGVPRAIHTPIMPREMSTISDFVQNGGVPDKVNMMVWDWEREAGESLKTPEVVREAVR